MRRMFDMMKLAAAAFFFFLAVRCSMRAGETAETVNVFLTGEALSRKQASEIISREAEQEQPDFPCFWGEQQECQVECRGNGQRTDVTLVVLEGNPKLVFREADVLAWQENGCLVDRATAQELFGTGMAEGQILWYKEKPYTVCGTIDNPRKLMVCRATEADGEILTAVSLETGRNRSPSGAAEQFLMRSGLSGEVTEFAFLCSLAGNLLLVLPSILVFSFCRVLFCENKGMKTWKGRGVALLGTAAAVTALIVLLKGRLNIPADMIPSRWSDFSFWKNWWKEQQENLWRVLTAPMGAAQLSMVWNLMKSLVYNLTAVFFGIAFCTEMERRP